MNSFHTFEHASCPVVVARQVTLVGAGPGDPEQLTLKAIRAIGAATFLLVDDLVNEAVLQYAGPRARIVRVGKRGGKVSTSQAFIDSLMVKAAKEGESVVRLKGGDPLVFGRGGEEMEYLRAHGIQVNVVNGISAGLSSASALGVALTHREKAHGVVFVTGHAKPGGEEVDWSVLARTAHHIGLTLVIYMGVANAATIQAGLLQGLTPDTPAAVVQNASHPEERHAVCRLADLCATLTREALSSPSVIVVGDVLAGLAQVSAVTPSYTRYAA